MTFFLLSFQNHGMHNELSHVENVNPFSHIGFWKTLLSPYVQCVLSTIYLTLSHIHLIWSRQLWKHLEKNMENLWKWNYNNYWIELKKWWQKENFFVLSNFFFVAMFSKSLLLKTRQKVSTWGKGLSADSLVV